MTLFYRTVIASALVLSLSVPAAWAQAQAAQPQSTQPAPQERGGPGGYGPGMMWGDGYGPDIIRGGGYGPGMMQALRGGRFGDQQAADSFVQRRLAFEKAGLKITLQQTPLWDKYAESVRANAKTVAAQREIIATRDGSQDSLPDRLQVRQELMAVQLDSMRKMITALRPLYASLDTEQKAQVDSFIGFGVGTGPGMF
ncbi:MAG TPA: Spy/CpxP family protein refolding chaperone [Stellaceae bacterium]|jgi:hypothetical protein|nr:Spy/CpxP family protein refolding chaperone [Stellaceae bacterium]